MRALGGVTRRSSSATRLLLAIISKLVSVSSAPHLAVRRPCSASPRNDLVPLITRLSKPANVLSRHHEGPSWRRHWLEPGSRDHYHLWRLSSRVVTAVSSVRVMALDFRITLSLYSVLELTVYFDSQVHMATNVRASCTTRGSPTATN